MPTIENLMPLTAAYSALALELICVALKTVNKPRLG
jgi:hypothetical protein